MDLADGRSSRPLSLCPLCAPPPSRLCRGLLRGQQPLSHWAAGLAVMLAQANHCRYATGGEGVHLDWNGPGYPQQSPHGGHVALKGSAELAG